MMRDTNFQPFSMNAKKKFVHCQSNQLLFVRTVRQQSSLIKHFGISLNLTKIRMSGWLNICLWALLSIRCWKWHHNYRTNQINNFSITSSIITTYFVSRCLQPTHVPFKWTCRAEHLQASRHATRLRRITMMSNLSLPNLLLTN